MTNKYFQVLVSIKIILIQVRQKEILSRNFNNIRFVGFMEFNAVGNLINQLSFKLYIIFVF